MCDNAVRGFHSTCLSLITHFMGALIKLQGRLDVRVRVVLSRGQKSVVHLETVHNVHISVKYTYISLD